MWPSKEKELKEKSSKNKKKKIFDNQIVKPWRVHDVANYMNCSEKHIYELARKGLIPSYKKGKFRYFIPSEIEDWLLE